MICIKKLLEPNLITYYSCNTWAAEKLAVLVNMIRSKLKKYFDSYDTKSLLLKLGDSKNVQLKIQIN